jgi:hypothetical protein
LTETEIKAGQEAAKTDMPLTQLLKEGSNWGIFRKSPKKGRERW